MVDAIKCSFSDVSHPVVVAKKADKVVPKPGLPKPPVPHKRNDMIIVILPKGKAGIISPKNPKVVVPMAIIPKMNPHKPLPKLNNAPSCAICFDCLV